MKANSTDAQTLALDEPLPRVAGWWLAFDARTPEAQARRRFAERYGAEPERVERALGLLLVGPIEGQEHGR